MAIYEVFYKRSALKHAVIEAKDEDEANFIAHEWKGMIDWNDDDYYETDVNNLFKMTHHRARNYKEEVREGRKEPPKKRLSLTHEERKKREALRSQLNGFN